MEEQTLEKAHQDHDTATQRRAEVLSVALGEGDLSTLRSAFEAQHPGETADFLESLSNVELRQLISLGQDLFTGDILAELDDSIRSNIVSALDEMHVAGSIVGLDTDDATFVLDDLDEGKKQRILGALPTMTRLSLEKALDYPENSAGRLMQANVVAVPQSWNVGQLLEALRNLNDLPERFFEVFVVDSEFRPVGSVLLSKLLKTPRFTQMGEITDESTPVLGTAMDKEDVAYLFRQYHLVSAPVIDADGKLVGMITVDDVVVVTSDESQEDLLALSGVDSEEIVRSPLFRIFRSRFGWLFINLLTACLASVVISFFDATLQQIVTVAIIMPIIASMGGNVGTQTLAVAISNMANKNLSSANYLRTVLRETMLGILNGMAFAVIAGVMAACWTFFVFGDAMQVAMILGIVVGMAMIVTLLCAGAAGIIIPLALDRVGADPAVASTVFVTTVTDVVGFFSFLGLATFFLL